MSDNPIDDASSDVAQMLRIMLQLAALIQLRARTRSMEQAQAIGKEHNQLMKEAREQQIREARQSKARDPRNQELARMLDVPVPGKGVSLARPPAVPERWDSNRRREDRAAYLSRIVSPEQAKVIMLADIGQARHPSAAVETRPATLERTEQHAREQADRRRAVLLEQSKGRTR